ncbi:MAG: ABC transporter permease [Candidatus Limnocylindria bacterium]
MIRLLRNLARRKLRTSLTILGITIGIWALVVFSSMANKINALVAGGSEYYANKIIVTDASGGPFGNAPMEIALADDVAAIDGVDVVVPQIQMLLDAEGGGGGFGVPDLIIGDVPGSDEGREEFEITYTQGRALSADDEGQRVTALGADLANRLAASPGDTVELRGRDFEVVGVIAPTLTGPDTTAQVPLAAAQELYADDLPPVVAEALAPDEIVSQVVVYPDEGADIAAVAERIEDEVTNVSTLTGEEFDAQVGTTTAIFNAIIIGVAVISLVVGGLSVINTMAMSVAERTREIGIKRAIGGSRGRIVRELLLEAGAIGLIGGLLGLGLGALVVVLANEAGRESGTILFDLTPGTAVFSVAFSTVLGMLAGVVPAWSASRLDPVQALRYE